MAFVYRYLTNYIYSLTPLYLSYGVAFAFLLCLYTFSSGGLTVVYIISTIGRRGSLIIVNPHKEPTALEAVPARSPNDILG